jgi:hypothetical protein
MEAADALLPVPPTMAAPAIMGAASAARQGAAGH